MTQPPASEEPPPEKQLNPWLILGLIAAPAALAYPMVFALERPAALAPMVFAVESVELIYAMPVIAGILCTLVFIRDGLRIQREEDPDLTTGFVIFRSLFFGIACALASGAFMFGACLCMY